MPVEPEFIPIARPYMDEREADAARRPILTGWITQGPEVAAFEREFAAHVRAPHACAVSSCTAGLHLALLAVGVGPGDEVITASHSFIATANAIRYCGARPVFADIEPSTFNLDSASIQSAISERTRAILCVHQMGMPADLPVLCKLARKHGIALIEDAACAIGSEICIDGEWQPVGRPHGDIACFSLHPRKVISTGDGGMLTTGNADWDRAFRLGRQHGMSVPDTVRHGSRQVVFEEYVSLGFNYRMTDIQAAVGREQLKRLPEIVARRRKLADRYQVLLRDVPEIRPPVEPAWARSNWQSYCVRLPAGCDQRGVMQFMLDEQVATRRGVMCAHLEPAYPRETWGHAPVPSESASPLPESERAQRECILLPLYAQLTEAQQERVVATLSRALRAVCAKTEKRG